MPFNVQEVFTQQKVNSDWNTE